MAKSLTPAELAEIRAWAEPALDGGFRSPAEAATHYRKINQKTLAYLRRLIAAYETERAARSAALKACDRYAAQVGDLKAEIGRLHKRVTATVEHLERMRRTNDERSAVSQFNDGAAYAFGMALLAVKRIVVVAPDA